MSESILNELRERDNNQYIYFVRGLSIIERLNENLFEAYFVGGVVRDLLLKLPFNDIDIATSATPEQVKNLFPEVDMKFAEYGSVTLREGPMVFEITTFRTEKYRRSRKLEKVHYSKLLSSDIIRRDYTVNALAFPRNLQLIDFVGGEKDLKKKKVRIIGKGTKRYQEDPLRIFRGLHLVAKYDFNLTFKTSFAMKHSSSNITEISNYHLTTELHKILISKHFLKAFNYIDELNLFKYKPVYSKWAKQILTKGKKLKVLDKFTLLYLNNDGNIEENTGFDHKSLTTMKESIQAANSIACDPVTPMFVFTHGLEKSLLYDQLNYIYLPKYKKQARLIKKYYKKLPIKSPKELKIIPTEIIEILGKEKSYLIKDIIEELIELVVTNQLLNSKEELRQAVFQIVNRKTTQDLQEPEKIKEETLQQNTEELQEVDPVEDIYYDLPDDAVNDEYLEEENYDYDDITFEEEIVTPKEELSEEEKKLLVDFENDCDLLYNIYKEGLNNFEHLSFEEQIAIEKRIREQVKDTVLKGNPKYRILKERGIL